MKVKIIVDKPVRPGPSSLVEGESTFKVIGCVPESVMKKLLKYCKKNKTSRSEAIRIAVTKMLEGK